MSTRERHDGQDRPARKQRVAVVGAGIAGLSAARSLAQCGFDVTLYERFDLLGGKLKGWQSKPARLDQARSHAVEHGMHGWWRNYRNFIAFFKERNAWDGQFHDLTDFVLVDSVSLERTDGAREGRVDGRGWAWLMDESLTDTLWDGFSLRGLFRVLAPGRFRATVRLVLRVLDLFGLWGTVRIVAIGIMLRIRWLSVFIARRKPMVRLLIAILSPDPPCWLDRWDLNTCLHRIGLPQRANQMFVLFQSMLTYGEPEKISAFHIARCLDFYLFRTRDAFWFSVCKNSAHRNAVLPLAEACRQAGVTIRTHKTVTTIRAEEDHVVLEFPGDQCRFDYVVSAVDAVGEQRIAQNNQAAGYSSSARIDALMGSQMTTQVKALRLWFDGTIDWKRRWDGEVRPGWALLRVEESGCPFDFLFVLSGWQEGVSAHDGEVLEVHLSRASRYSAATLDELCKLVRPWLLHLFPELEHEQSLVHAAMSDVRTFTASPAGHLGLSLEPDESPRWKFAGDGTYLRDHPHAYMEKAFLSGVLAARAIASDEGVPQPAIVPLPPVTSRIQRNAKHVTEQLDSELGKFHPPSDA